MDKIKDKNTGESFFWLESKLFANPLERAKLHLGIAKNFFIFSAFLYFFSLLMTVGGTFTEYSAQAAFFLYPLFVFSTLALLYNICSYGIVIYLEWYLFLRYIVFVLCSVAFLWIIGIYLWIHTFLSSINFHFQTPAYLSEYSAIFTGYSRIFLDYYHTSLDYIIHLLSLLWIK